MPQIRIGVQLATFGQPFKQAVMSAASVGADCIEIDARSVLRPHELTTTALRQIRKMLDDLKISVVSVRFQTRRGYDELDDLDRRIDATRQAMKMASDLGCRVVVNQVGNLQRDEPAESNEYTESNPLNDALIDLGRYGQRIGAFLCHETGSEELDVVADAIEQLPEGTLGVALNPGNLVIRGFDLQSLGRIARHVMLVYAKDGISDRARGGGIDVPLGRGLVDFYEIMASLEEHPSNHGFVIDLDLRTPQLSERLRQSVEFLKNVAAC